MQNIFALDYTGSPFVIFSAAHLAALGLIILLILYFILNRMHFS